MKSNFGMVIVGAGIVAMESTFFTYELGNVVAMYMSIGFAIAAAGVVILLDDAFESFGVLRKNAEERRKRYLSEATPDKGK